MKIKQILLIFTFSLLLINCENRTKSINSSTERKKRTNDCNGYGDKSFIESKMKQMDRDIIEFTEIGKRKYYIRYISWRTGSAVNGDQILDYKNSPCRD
jgi:hypothetical protein|tara:strand:- start:101 stop:397 length:297 start_codon:yes stop_codon:yes gene_type:complete